MEVQVNKKYNELKFGHWSAISKEQMWFVNLKYYQILFHEICMKSIN